jgi:hypothetical protein
MSLADAALGAAGMSHDAVTSAWAAKLKGNEAPINALMDQAASNLGMPSSQALREQILPSLGLQY